jgi:Tol biopolymer transport system component
VKFSIVPPEKSRFHQSAAFLAVSPDGRNVAYIASLQDGTSCLWVRPIDSVDARPLAGTERAGQPFWSPDGRFIAYTQDEKLKKIAVSGEPPQTVAESPVSNGPQGGSWGINDVILFSPNRQLGLYRVSAAGGAPSVVVATDNQHGDIAVGWPTFLPDGRHFLYRVLSGQEDRTGIFVGSLDSPERRRLTSIDSNTSYAEPGFLVYQQEGVLTAQKFDLYSFQLVGNPIVLARQLTYNHLNGRGSFSATERVLAYREVNDARLSWLDRNGVILSSIGEPAHYLELSLSPDGNRALVTRVDASRNTSDIWLVDTIHGLTSQLTFAPSSEQTPIWSPDGDEFVFAANPDEFFNLYRKPVAAGGGEQRLLASKSNQRPLDWSRGGRLVFEQSPAPDRIGGLWVLPLLQPPMATRIDVPSRVNGASAQISPDGQWLAWVSAPAGQEEVYVQAFPIQGDARRVSSQGGTEPLWRRDMTELFYLAPNGDLMAVPITKTPAMKFGTPRALFGTALGELTNITGRKRYAVTPDGNRFLMAIPRGGSESAPITVVLNWAGSLAR